MIYVDNAATTKISDLALEQMLKIYHGNYSNPSSIHKFGEFAKSELEKSRDLIADCLNCKAKNLYFTSGGSESDNQAIISAALEGEKVGKKHIVSTMVEHHAVLRTLSQLKKRGFSVTLVSPDRFGWISPKDIADAIRPETCLVSVMFANNEVGTIMPIKEIGHICKEKNIVFHTDAVQAVGHVKIDLQELGVGLLSASSHKFNGPNGVGFLYCKNPKIIHPIIKGGSQEFGKRAGTENLAGISGMAVALKESCENMDCEYNRISRIRNDIENRLLKISGSRVNGSVCRIPGNLNIGFAGVDSESLVMMLSNEGIMCSQGSACSSNSIEPSHVLKAMNIPKEYINGCIRISLGKNNKSCDAEKICVAVEKCVNRLRGIKL